MHIAKALLALLVAGGLSASALAQQEYIITLKDKRVEGAIIDETDDHVTLQTEYGDLRFRKLNLKEIKRANQPAAPPFGNPESDTGGGNPFANEAGFSGDSVEIGGPGQQDAEPQEEPLPVRREVSPPPVPFTENALIFGLTEETQVRVRSRSGAAPSIASGPDPVNLREDNVVETAERPVRVVLKNNQDILRIAPRTTLTLDEAAESSIDLTTSNGTVWAQVDPQLSDRDFVVRLNNAVVTSNGGVFRVTDALDRGVHVALVEGSATVDSINAQIALEIPEGQMLLVRPDGSMTPSFDVSRVIKEEDALWDELDEDWWFNENRIELGNEYDQPVELISLNEARSQLSAVANAFFRFAEDTKHIPTEAEAFSVLRQNTGDWPNWNGPYWDGLLPPLDSFGRTIRYTNKATGSAGNQVGVVYSFGEDNVDNKGDASADVAELILYYQIDGLQTASN